jgi:hypothetical protein
MRISAVGFIGIVCAVSFTSLGFVSPVVAGTVFEAARVDARTMKSDLDIRVYVGDQGARVDVSANERLLLSYIESAERLTLVDHAAGIYVVNAVGRIPSPIWSPTLLRSTSRSLFALGGYCPSVEIRWSEVAHLEQCLAREAKDEVNPSFLRRTKVGEFLRLVTAGGDKRQLFEQATRILNWPSVEAGFPYAIRYFEDGRLVGEVRMLRAQRVLIPRRTFDVPKGVRRVPTSAVLAEQVSH